MPFSTWLMDNDGKHVIAQSNDSCYASKFGMYNPFDVPFTFMCYAFQTIVGRFMISSL